MSEAAITRAFVSYSWTSPDHQQWVLNLATELVEHGIHVIIDRWDLRPGEDANHFMERIVNDSTITKVIMVCDKAYKTKADARSGGAGTEAQILSPELYRSRENTKFCAVVSEVDDEGKPYLPTYYASRIYIDFSDAEKRSEKVEELVRWVYDRPLLVRPTLGRRPSYLNEGETGPALGTASRARRAIDAVKNHTPFWKSALKDYFDTFADGLEGLRIPDGPTYADDFLKSIQSFVPYRNEALEVIKTVASQNALDGAYDEVQRFVERLLPYTVVQEGRNQCKSTEFDNFRFAIYELFLLSVATAFKQENFAFAGALINQEYFAPAVTRFSGKSIVSFTVLQTQEMHTIENINHQSNQRKISYRAELISQRIAGTGLTMVDVGQADLLLSLKARASNDYWVPDTLLYVDRHSSLPIFARSRSKRYFNKVTEYLALEFNQVREVVTEIDGHGGLFRQSVFGLKLAILTGLDELCSIP